MRVFFKYIICRVAIPTWHTSCCKSKMACKARDCCVHVFAYFHDLVAYFMLKELQQINYIFIKNTRDY